MMSQPLPMDARLLIEDAKYAARPEPIIPGDSAATEYAADVADLADECERMADFIDLALDTLSNRRRSRRPVAASR